MDMDSVSPLSSWPHHHFRAMGTQIDLWVEADPPDAQAAFAEAVGCFHDAEAALSRFDPASELSHLNARSGEWVHVSRLLWDVLTLALDFADESDGIFDPTVLGALKAAGYDRSFTQIGSGGQAAGGHPHTPTGGWRSVEVDPAGRAVRLPAGVGLDFGGIAKGYTAGWAARWLGVWGPGLVDAGGDLVAGDPPRGKPGWPVTILAPRIDGQVSDTVLASLPLANGALATSGVDHRFWLVDGRPAHHIIDPRTGQPADTDALTVTVMTPGGPAAEVWAKVALIGGVEVGMALLGQRGIPALVVDRGRALHVSPLMQAHLDRQAVVGIA
jgi:thiamine biosynthesis lipoprotein